jgi:hypothetical protein
MARDGGSRSVEARVWLGIFAAMVLVGTGLGFEGGWRVGPRYVVVALPALIFGLVRAWGDARTDVVWMTAAGVLVTWSLAVNALAGNFWPHIDPTNVNAPVLELLVPLLRAGHSPYGPLHALGGQGAWLLFALPVVVGLGALLRHASPGLGGVAGFAVGAAAALGLVFGVPALPVEPHPRAPANLRYVESVYEPGPGEPPVSRALEPAGRGSSGAG